CGGQNARRALRRRACRRPPGRPGGARDPRRRRVRRNPPGPARGRLLRLREPGRRGQPQRRADGGAPGRAAGVRRRRDREPALRSQRRWAAAQEAGRFADELAPVDGVESDEHPRPDTGAEKLAALEPAFRVDGTVTAGNSSGINDGAAALVIASEEKARELGAEPLGAFVGSAVAGVDPRVMGIGPIPAVKKLLARAGIEPGRLDLVELNEAFASQSLVVIRELALDEEKVNVNGGAIALGHPLGMSG